MSETLSPSGSEVAQAPDFPEICCGLAWFSLLSSPLALPAALMWSSVATASLSPLKARSTSEYRPEVWDVHCFHVQGPSFVESPLLMSGFHHESFQ